MNLNADDLVKAYLAIRDERDILKTNFEEKDKSLKEELSVLQASLLSICNEQGANSIKTSAGTAIRKMSERFYTQDWDSFKQFVVEHDALDLFEKRIHQGNMRSFLEEHKDLEQPPGLNVLREFQIVVRKS